MPARQFTILPPLEFIADVREEMTHAKKRLYLQAMEVEPGQITNHLMDLLFDATAKGLDARLHVDYYSLLILDGIFTYMPLLSKSKEAKRRHRIQKRDEYFAKLKEAGVKLMFTNPPSLMSKILPVIGRNHIKIVIVDDVAWIGGINFHDGNFKNIDSMVKLTDEAIVSEISKLYLDIEQRKVLSDQKIRVTEGTSLIIDGGKVNRSMILEEAIKLIGRAEESIRVVTPIVPDTALAKALMAARKKGRKIQVITHAINQMGGIYKPLDLFNAVVLSLHPNKFPLTYLHKQLHAKILLIDNKHVLMGSHNLTSRGVAIGTQELAISSSDPFFTSQAVSFFDHLETL